MTIRSLAKIAMVHGTAGSAYTGYVPGDSRLCVHALKMQDGPVGVRMNNTTQLPAAVGVAASFDPSLARSYGTVIGAEEYDFASLTPLLRQFERRVVHEKERVAAR